MKTYLKLFISISFLLTACTSLKVNQDAAFEYTNYSSIYSHYLACDSEYVTRMPSAAEMCSELFKSHEAPSTLKETEYLKKLQANPLARAEANMAKSMEADPYPISLSSEMRRFRDRVLGYIKNTSYRETLVRSFESALRMKSNLLESAMASKNNYSNYDLVIVGTGVHGIIALHKAISMDPGLKILLIDEGDTAGATFRYGKEVFDINSSNRRSGEDTRPLPGEGNINELPYLPIQVSDLTAVKYPTANDLGTALVAGLYAAVREHPGVDVLFNARANQVALTAQDPKFKESLTFQSTATGRSFRVDAQAVITATGLGEPSLPEKVAQTVKARPELAQETTPDKIPRVITFEDYLRILGSSNEPGKFFSNKKIGIVGKGDSAKVLIQYLLGFAPREGYARTSAQDGQVARIYWIGQDAKTCQDYINAEGSRSRYGNIGTAFKSSNAKVEAILKPTAGLKLYDVYVNSKYGMIKALLENGTNTEALDYIVVTTGFEQNLRQLFTTFSDNQSQKFPTDTDYFKADFTAIRGKTATVSNETNLGLKLKDRNVYVLGTAAGNIVPKEELVGIIQNSVSIFNNAPRVVAATEQITRELYRKASGNQVFAQKIMPVSKEARLGFLVTDIQESRFIPNQTLVFLQSSFREALTFVRPSSLEKIVISVSLAKDGNLLVTSKTDLDVRPLVELLASSREFFSLSRELLKFTPKQSLILIAEASANGYNISQAQAQLIKADKSEPPQTQVVKNGQFKLRGLNREISDNQDASKIANKNREEAEQKKREEEKERQKALDISANLINSAKKMIFNEILPGKFNMTDAVTRVTITKPFALAQTQTTQLQWSVIQILLGKTDPKEINPSYFKTEDEAKLIEYSGIKVQLKPDHPVEQVSYNDITAWIAGLNKLSQEGNDQIQSEIQKVIPGHKKGDVYDLPTEAQWAFVMQNRGKNNEAYFDRLIPDELDQYAWYGGEKFTSTQTHAVATKKPRKIDSGDGKIVDFYDLEGNVWEIMNNRFSGRPEGGVDPIGPSSTQVKLLRLTRGGAWNYVAKKGSVNVRSIISSDYADYSHGFRLLKKVNDPVSDRVSDRSPLRKFFDLLFSPGG